MGLEVVREVSDSAQKVLSSNGGAFPLILSGGGSSCGFEDGTEQYISNNRDALLASLNRHGAVLLRGFAVKTPQDFAKVMELLKIEIFPYVGGNAVRRKVVGDRVFTANESPPERIIPFHHELAQTPSFPTRIAFYCELPAEKGGETPIVHSAEVYDVLAREYPQFVAQLETHGVIYSRVMTSHDRSESAIGRGWKSTFNVNEMGELEDLLAEKGEKCEWLKEDGGLVRHSSQVLPAVREWNGRKVFFNQLVAAYTGWRDEHNTPSECVRLGNGEEMDARALEFASELLDRMCVAMAWQAGDVLLVDNMSVMHARRTFKGPRRILASLGK
eukprot:CAMPEP_0185845390 /NCGR_PEP_ID=MMETSP1354-20130828/1385_1 /TAXON_ID=708628 /ORGANISM="Erythrolobus madagascarensis, Strain CCMP3276" /LENGTH=329 /DNA_ID=CAMNT_0028545349 /DNA_START=54 /DNA_END=1043 /DNA_ORIENTATION=+